MAVNTQGFGIQLATGGFSLEANTIFSSYTDALNYAKSSAAYEGKLISVTNGTEKGAYIVEAIGENASLKKVGSDVDLSNYVTKDQLTNVYTYKGSKDNYSDLPNNDSEVKPAAGDVWNVVNEYTSKGDVSSWIIKNIQGRSWQEFVPGEAAADGEGPSRGRAG